MTAKEYPACHMLLAIEVERWHPSAILATAQLADAFLRSAHSERHESDGRKRHDQNCEASRQRHPPRRRKAPITRELAAISTMMATSGTASMPLMTALQPSRSLSRIRFPIIRVVTPQLSIHRACVSLTRRQCEKPSQLIGVEILWFDSRSR